MLLIRENKDAEKQSRNDETRIRGIRNIRTEMNVAPSRKRRFTLLLMTQRFVTA